MNDYELCKLYKRLDDEYGTPLRSPLHHDNRCKLCATRQRYVITIWRTDGDDQTFNGMSHLLNNLIGPYKFYLEGEVSEE